MPSNLEKVLKRRYLMKNEQGEVIEKPAQMFRRVAKTVASAEKKYDSSADVKRIEDDFYSMMINSEFLPNSPTLMNAGTPIGQLSACFVLPVDDSIEGIFGAVEKMAIIHQSGGGTGFSFSRLRPRGDIVNSTKGVASGPISFMRIFDTATDVVKQGGRRRGANMGILRVDHPDVMEFVGSKNNPEDFRNFNISVAVDDKFILALEEDGDYDLINPHTRRVVKHLRADDIFSHIVEMAWKIGDPGIVFLDVINRDNPTPSIGKIESTNPCGEQPLLPYESCNLGSINLAKRVSDEGIDWDRLGEVVEKGVDFLDDVIDVNRFPLKEVEEVTKANRKIGLGVMGLADMLIQLGIPYDSEDALGVAEKVMKFIYERAKDRSSELGEIRGNFQNFEGSLPAEQYISMRNATVCTIAPTGSISIIAGCTSGIEPIFAVAFVRNVMEGARLLEINPYFGEVAKKRGFYSRDLMMKIAKKGSIQDIGEVPSDVRSLFVTAMEIEAEWHVRMQATVQRYVDNAVAKTVNLPSDATKEDVRKVFLLAHKLGCKGITVYRYGTKKDQVLYVGGVVDSEYSGGCVAGACPF
ncbi:MAG: adenosylcobalamin-dependent ribonucleoside-diphosphate reductase [Halobacteriota archaeon]|nr:adenosylcobalamin-dependent ribonucleoside-diphosphate reductase [Halobacteriota archaeon]